MKKISFAGYTAAIIKLLPVAFRDTGQSRRCAQVLLSAYNSYDYQVAIADLTCLDEDLQEACLMLILCRVLLNCEPQEMIKDGDKLFSKLWYDWEGSLKLANRAKVSCPVCDGRGTKYKDWKDEDGEECTYCSGSGRVCACKQ